MFSLRGTYHRDFLVRQRKHNFLLRAFIFCEDCGQRYTAEYHYNDKKLAKRGGKIAYYHCAKRGGCRSPYVQQEVLESMVHEKLKQVQFSKPFVTVVLRKAKAAFLKQRGTIDDDKKALLNQRTGVEVKRSLLEDKLLDKTIDSDTFKRKHMELQAQINALETQISDLEQKRQLDVDLVAEVLRFTQNIYKSYQKAPDFLKRHYLRFFFEKFYVKDKQIVRTVYSPIFEALQRDNAVILASDLLQTSSIKLYQLFPQDLLSQMQVKLEILKDLLGKDSNYATVKVKNGQFCQYSV